MEKLIQHVKPWLMKDYGPSNGKCDELLQLLDYLTWLQKEILDEYEPNRYESFDDRVVEWLKNVGCDSHRKSLFLLLGHLFFVGKQQFDSLCRTTYSDTVINWVLDVFDLNITDPNLSACIDDRMKCIWFCPVTDSMRINAFRKLNGLSGHSYCPDWRSLKKFGDPKKISNHISKRKIKGLVLLEDFVGTGKQMQSVVEWTASEFPEIPILIAPLICCPSGLQAGRNLASKNDKITFEPTLILEQELFLLETKQNDEPEVFTQIRKLIYREKHRLGDYQNEPFGFGSTGALVTLYSNCPNNTLPIIHHQGDQWTPLFHRVNRHN